MQAISSSASENMSPQIEAEAGDAYVVNYTYFASIALILYEHAFTIPAEILYVWSSRFTLITVLLLSNRYLRLALGLVYILNLIEWDTSWRCEFLIVTRTVIIMALQAVTAALSSLSTYAISGHKWIPALLALFLGLTPLITLLYGQIILSPFLIADVTQGSNCVYKMSRSKSVGKKVLVEDRIGTVCSALVALFVTWRKTYHTVRESHRAGLKTPLVSLVLRDGAVYFVSLLFAGLIEVMAWEFYLGSQGGNVRGTFPATFFAPIASMLASRFILNLRRANDHTLVTSSDSIDSRSMQFATRILGNIGAELEDQLFPEEFTTEVPEEEVDTDCEFGNDDTEGDE